MVYAEQPAKAAAKANAARSVVVLSLDPFTSARHPRELVSGACSDARASLESELV